MLTTLRISGLAIVDRAEVSFGPGLNVLTGETGAGKSILLEALHLVLGGRMSAEVLREGAEEAVVEAMFELPRGHPVAARLAERGIPIPEGTHELVVRRTASRSGRGRAFVNGALCTVSMLEASLRGLVDVTGQHEHVALLDESTHLALLDAYASAWTAGAGATREQAREGSASGEGHSGPPAPSRLLAYREARAALADALRERDALLLAREERGRRADYLAYQLRELDALAPRPGEVAELERERQVLAAGEKLRGAARSAEAFTYGGERSAAEQLGRAARALAEAAALEARLEPALSLVRSAQAEVEEAGRMLARYAEGAGGDPDRLPQVEERLEALRAVARKHGGTLEAAVARAEEMRVELASVESTVGRLELLEGLIADAGARAVGLAAELSRARSEAASVLARHVCRELEALAMGRCRVEVPLLPPENPILHAGVPLGPDGAERAQILLAPNPGEPARPLARIASGGELSRVLLAVKRSLARADPVATYVFDEVDAGIGGGVAEAVGRLLAEVSRERQVLCVTHLPQVAAFADRHLRVHKRVQGGRTCASVDVLPTVAERREEIARMLAGMTLTDSALQHAGSLISAAHAFQSEPPPATETGAVGRSVRLERRRSRPHPRGSEGSGVGVAAGRAPSGAAVRRAQLEAAGREARQGRSQIVKSGPPIIR